MKMTKRVAALATCAVMTVTSMVGMSASAASSDTTNAVYIGTAFSKKVYGQASISVSNGTAYGSTIAYVQNGDILPAGTLGLVVLIYDINGDCIKSTNGALMQPTDTNRFETMISTAATKGGNCCSGIVVIDENHNGSSDWQPTYTTDYVS
jgi:hypothetical protein